MTTTDLLQIEKTLSVSLPKYYKDFMLNYPSDLENDGNADYELIGYSDKVIAENIEAYKNLWGKPLNKQYLIIGENGCGDYFLIDLSGDNGIYSLFHDNKRFYKMADSLSDYCSKIRDGSFERNWGNENFRIPDLWI